jgi:hypothetical protein
MPNETLKPYLGKRFPPDDPRGWLNRARSNLAKAGIASETDVVYLEDLCFDAQQAAERAIKAVMRVERRFDYGPPIDALAWTSGTIAGLHLLLFAIRFDIEYNQELR